MAKKTGGKMLLVITTCMSIIATFSLLGNEPQHSMAGTKTTLYNEQNVVYGTQVAYETYCIDSNSTIQYSGKCSDRKIAVINMDKDSTVMDELAEIVDADLIDMPDDVSNINLSQYNTLFVNPSSDDCGISDDIKEFAGNINLDGKTIVVIYDVAQDIINGVSGADELMDNTVWLTGGKLSDNAGYEEIKNWVNGLGMELIADDEE